MRTELEGWQSEEAGARDSAHLATGCGSARLAAAGAATPLAGWRCSHMRGAAREEEVGAWWALVVLWPHSARRGRARRGGARKERKAGP